MKINMRPNLISSLLYHPCKLREYSGPETIEFTWYCFEPCLGLIWDGIIDVKLYPHIKT